MPDAPRRSLVVVAGVVMLLVTGAAALTIRMRALPQLSENPTPRVVGAFHAHSEDSHDSRLSWDTLAIAARKRRLDFLIITDHNKQRASPASLHGVTLLSYAELSTGWGHAVALGASYTLDKPKRLDPNVLQLVRGAGGLPVVTHPSDLKRPWTGTFSDVGGVEIANISASARRQGQPMMLGLLPLAAAWPLHRDLAFAQLYDRDAQALALWDPLPPEVIGLCGSDAHGWVDPATNLAGWSIVLDQPLAPITAAGVLRAVRDGQFHCSAGLLGHDPVFAFTAERRLPAGPITAPGQATVQEVAALTLVGPAEPHDAVSLVLIKDGHIWRSADAPRLVAENPPPGTYRAEVWAKIPRLVGGHRWVPAIYSQRITLTQAAAPP